MAPRSAARLRKRSGHTPSRALIVPFSTSGYSPDISWRQPGPLSAAGPGARSEVPAAAAVVRLGPVAAVVAQALRSADAAVAVVAAEPGVRVLAVQPAAEAASAL